VEGAAGAVTCLVVQKVLGDGRPIDDVGGGGEIDRVPHDGREQRVQELEGGVVCEIVDILHRVRVGKEQGREGVREGREGGGESPCRSSEQPQSVRAVKTKRSAVCGQEGGRQEGSNLLLGEQGESPRGDDGLLERDLLVLVLREMSGPPRAGPSPQRNHRSPQLSKTFQIAKSARG
jgi:hypothetical protein